MNLLQETLDMLAGCGKATSDVESPHQTHSLMLAAQVLCGPH